MARWSSSQYQRAFEGVVVREHVEWAEIKLTKRLKLRDGRVLQPGDTITVMKCGLVNLDEVKKDGDKSGPN
jgi:hypothetical protein